MNTGEKLPTKIRFPFSLYLQQLFSTDVYVRFINPVKFWRKYKINHLETCCELDTVRHLELCLQLDWQYPRLLNFNRNTDYINISTHALVKQAESNTIIISQPTVQLKHRGVIYHMPDIK